MSYLSQSLETLSNSRTGIDSGTKLFYRCAIRQTVVMLVALSSGRFSSIEPVFLSCVPSWNRGESIALKTDDAFESVFEQTRSLCLS